MPEILTYPKAKRKVLVDKVKCACGAKFRVFKNDPYWTEYGNTEIRCPHCRTCVFIGRLGLKDS